jgi:hypothetical protein
VHLDLNFNLDLRRDTTASSDQDISSLSPRQREKQPARDLDPLDTSPARLRNLPLREPEPAHTLNTDVLEQGLLPRPRSFLATLQQRIIPRDSRPAASRVLNPINYLPRPTPIEVTRPGYSTDKTSTLAPGLRETRTLLTLPEQRRSRQNSPGSPVVEHSPVVTDPGSHRSSIGLPVNRSSRNLELTKSRDMIASENEKPLPDPQAPERAHVPFSRYNSHEHDLEAATNVPASQSILGQGYGVTKDDQPLHPPRRITSQRSLRHHKSTASLRSARYSVNYGNSRLPSRDGSFVQHRQESRVGGSDSPEDQGSLSEELAWGPAHPCFPHKNTHVPVNSPEYTDTRIIRIKRDWMVKGDLAPTFSNLYPEILDPLVSEPEFRRVIQHINQTLVDAFDPFAVWNWLDGLLGVATGWLWEDFRPSGVKGKLRRLESWIEDWNLTMGMRDGVKIIPLRRTGYMTLDFQIPDPQVRVVGEASTMAPASSVGGYR